MAPKRRSTKLVGSVVKTKVVQETVEVIVSDDPDHAPPPPPTVVDMSSGGGSTSSRVVRVEVTTPDGDTAGAAENVKPPQPAKRGRGRRDRPEEAAKEKEAPAPAPAPADDDAADAAPAALQSQETQDPNEQADDDGSKNKKKKKQRQEETEEEEQQPETPKVASERRKTTQGRRGGAEKTTTTQRRRRRGRLSPRGEEGMGGMGGYRRYVWQVLKQVHPELGVSGRAMEVLDMFIADMFERLAEEAARLTKATGRATLTSREVQSAVRLVLPGELGKHAISEGVKAISKYTSHAA
ncbi:hypothetical protein ACP4OV_031734 [Aristida adscensionis]